MRFVVLACAVSACGPVRGNPDDIVIVDGSPSQQSSDASVSRDAGSDASGCAVLLELLSNGDFDEAPIGVDWTEAPIALVVPDAGAPSAPNLAAFHGKPAILESKDLPILSDFSHLRVRFAMRSTMSGNGTTDSLSVAMVDQPFGTNVPFATLAATTSSGWETRAFQISTASVSPLARLSFASVTDGGTTFLVDAVSLAGLKCP